jgi:hypothetical protein
MGRKTVPVGIDDFLAHFSGPGALCRADRLDIGGLAQTGNSFLKRSEIAGIDRTDRACNLCAAAFGGPENIGAGNARLFSLFIYSHTQTLNSENLLKSYSSIDSRRVKAATA